jgi:hypothetical protein
MSLSPQQIADHRERLDLFAEMLSLDIEIPLIRERLGLSKGGAYSLLAKLRAKYGWQAA